jgi:hypothetical protein
MQHFNNYLKSIILSHFILALLSYILILEPQLITLHICVLLTDIYKVISSVIGVFVVFKALWLCMKDIQSADRISLRIIVSSFWSRFQEIIADEILTI